jgi:putrescine transport system permease protein
MNGPGTTLWHRVTRRLAPLGRLAVGLPPYLWLIIFFALPFLLVLKISLSESIYAIPPYAPIMQMADETFVQIRLNLANYQFLLWDDLYPLAYLNSLKIAAISTFICLLIGYPVAYAIARSNKSIRYILLMLVVIPFWTSLLIRVYAWVGILKDNGLLNNFLIWAHLIHDPLPILYTDTAIYIGIVYSYLPFMILPLYATLEKMDLSLLEAAEDLGCTPFKAFLLITLPLSLPGIIAGSMLVFIPAVGEFVIPELLGGPGALMIGKVLWTDFFNNRDWPVAASVAVAMLVLLVFPIMLVQYLKSRSLMKESAR